MKKMNFITAILVMFMIAAVPVSAQENNGFKKIDVKEDFTENGFQWFHDAELLAAGNKEKSNAMTIGWGGIGTLWGRTALTVYVAEKRYTKAFMDKAEYYTVMTFDVAHSKVLRYMGTKSGRDGDKAAAHQTLVLLGQCLDNDAVVDGLEGDERRRIGILNREVAWDIMTVRHCDGMAVFQRCQEFIDAISKLPDVGDLVFEKRVAGIACGHAEVGLAPVTAVGVGMPLFKEFDKIFEVGDNRVGGHLRPRLAGPK